VALFAAEKHFSPSEIDGLRLAFGNIALADRVLHQHLPFPLEVLGPFLLREKGLFYSPVNDSQKDYIDEKAPHILIRFPEKDDFLPLRQLRKELRNRLMEQGMPQVRGDIIQGSQDEPALVKPGMGNH
jgi:hypothetical protein